ncbi:hypothetical protein F4775DRAFT_288088 [Biscogniauxia sp. FL1348]|nr:hypothetical protein F4775DRAFT_288088 [Biscogniauxia sp. FL1348]
MLEPLLEPPSLWIGRRKLISSVFWNSLVIQILFPLLFYFSCYFETSMFDTFTRCSWYTPVFSMAIVFVARAVDGAHKGWRGFNRIEEDVKKGGKGERERRAMCPAKW